MDPLSSISRSWALYFPFNDFDPNSEWTQATVLFRDFFANSVQGRKLLGTSQDLDVAFQLTFNYERFLAFLPENLKSFEIVLKSHAATTLSCLGLALCSLRMQIERNDLLAPRLRPIVPRFVNFRPLTPLLRMKSDLIGKFVAVRGNVVRVCGIRPMVKRMEFACMKCGERVTKDLPDGKYEPPSQCENGKCKSRLFEADKKSALTVDFQRVKLQEIVEDDFAWPFKSDDDDDLVVVGEEDGENHGNHEGGNGGKNINGGSDGGGGEGRVPRTINIELTDDLVDRCSPGDVVVVSGIVKAMNPESIEGRGSRSKGKGREVGLLLLLIEANAIENGGRGSVATNREDEVNTFEKQPEGGSDLRGTNDDSTASAGQGNGDKSDVVETLTQKDLRIISAIARERDFAYLVYSFCPLIFGNEHVKAGLLLGLIGGCSMPDQGSSSKSVVGVRSDAHVLVVGDPGLGKSQMLRFASTVAPRGVYVCGNTTSSTGLTVTLGRDAGGEYSLEAGALVLADRGVCCVDEFDKMSNQHNALLETMEQQTVSIAKAGVICTLSARTAVLAAANPKGGSYRRDKTLLENLNLPAPLLSRFDMVFIMLDTNDARKDAMLAKHIVGMHTSRVGIGGAATAAISTATQRLGGVNGVTKSSRYPVAVSIYDKDDTLDRPFKQRIGDTVQQYEAEGEEKLPPPLIRKYIAYARHYVPDVRLSFAAARRLQRFYLELRARGKKFDSIPVTTRNLESMIRLTQARARVELRPLATERDAIDVISLVEDGLLEIATDECGRVDMTKMSGMSQSKMQKTFVEILKRACMRRLNPYFTRDELEKEAAQVGLLSQILDFSEFLERLADHCFLLKKPGGFLVSRSVHGLANSTQGSTQQ